MIRKAIISVLTLAALGTLTVRALTHHTERAGGWSLRSSSWLGNRVVLHHRYIVFAHDKVLPGQIPDPEFGVRVSAVFRAAEKSGELTPSNGIMEDSFADSGFLGVRWGHGQFVDEFGLRTDCWVVYLPLRMPLVVFATYPRHRLHPWTAPALATSTPGCMPRVWLRSDGQRLGRLPRMREMLTKATCSWKAAV